MFMTHVGWLFVLHDYINISFDNLVVHNFSIIWDLGCFSFYGLKNTSVDVGRSFRLMSSFELDSQTHLN